MSRLHDYIKINLTSTGYLKNYPYHMISDEEMCDAFLSSGTCYFKDMYPLLDSSLSEPYEKLITTLSYYMQECKNHKGDEYQFPDWVYSYMLGNVISVSSDPYDIYGLSKLFNISTEWGEFSTLLSLNCYRESQKWISRNSEQLAEFRGNYISLRPPTMFGEPHVLKSLRLKSVQIGDAYVEIS